MDRVVALETVRGPAAADDRARFIAEAKIAARLEHPGVVPVHELAGPPGSTPYYTMKLVNGRTLEEAIRLFHTATATETDRAVARQSLLNAFLAVTRTMAFAHSRGVIHRDLKPANI